MEVKQAGHSGDDAGAYRERERRAKIIHADGEYQTSAKLAEAAAVLETQPAAIQLRQRQSRYSQMRAGIRAVQSA
jgi:hypothetical protein